ncbi:YchJ family protein [Pseudomonas sp. F1_0610]|uniref:YchJ family protein n=1 Tax=Pseudomonas sp. F1_0610 TaxID=3114284 RepID=UPI0039C4DCC0
MPATMCRCNSEKPYAQCCKPYHLGELAPDAEKLMRSRYCAFAIGDIAYLVRTTVPNQQRLLDQTAMYLWSTQSQWLGLQVIDYQAYTNDRSRVEFIAKWQDKNGEHSHHECSEFVLRDGAWYFLDSTLGTKLGRNDNCICQSGKKFKKCCALYLP